MQFTLRFVDISLWLAVTSIILLATSEFISLEYGQIGLIVEKKHLQRVAIILGVLFLFTVALRIFEIALSS